MKNNILYAILGIEIVAITIEIGVIIAINII